jgi:hypothetical protein
LEEGLVDRKLKLGQVSKVYEVEGETTCVLEGRKESVVEKLVCHECRRQR